jgi:hypothetical protein
MPSEPSEVTFSEYTNKGLVGKRLICRNKNEFCTYMWNGDTATGLAADGDKHCGVGPGVEWFPSRSPLNFIWTNFTAVTSFLV